MCQGWGLGFSFVEAMWGGVAQRRLWMPGFLGGRVCMRLFRGGTHWVGNVPRRGVGHAGGTQPHLLTAFSLFPLSACLLACCPCCCRCCRFFSILFLRAAKLHSAFGGGSMTLLPLVPGRPASGTKASLDLSKYQTLSEEQKAKLQEVLDKRKVGGCLSALFISCMCEIVLGLV